MKLVVTGGRGFLGWHLRCRALVMGLPAPVVVDRGLAADVDRFATVVADADVVIHAAGVNRAETDAEVGDGNRSAALQLAAALRRSGSQATLVYANSRQIDGGSVYGTAKRAAAEILAGCADDTGGAYHDVVLPHLFGEFGRPFYNSAVHTFAHQLVRGEEPVVRSDANLELLGAQDAASLLIERGTEGGPSGQIRPSGRMISVAEVLARMRSLLSPYRATGSVPRFESRFDRQLFNTMRSNDFPDLLVRPLTVHRDHRGGFYEVIRADGRGQTSISTTAPGIRRGDHFHVDKIERFVVVRGSAEIELRRLFTDEVITCRVSGDEPVFVDMPTLTTHSIVNTGDDELVTLFWADDHFDPEHPDTHSESVRAEAPEPAVP